MMKKKRLGLALSALMAGGLMVGNIEAVTLTPDGLGDAAIVDYYTVNNGWQTIFRLINTSDKAVVVKVRFQDAANTRDVLDFFVFLSPYDMWQAWTDPDALKDLGDGPGIRTKDTSCVYPLPNSSWIPNETWFQIDPVNNPNLIAAAFKTRAFTGDYDDGGAFKADGTQMSDTERVSEGHVQFFGVASFDPNDPGIDGNFAQKVIHNSRGEPQDCQGAAALFEGGQLVGEDVGNVLAFNSYLLNVSEGLGGGYQPTVLYDFANRSMISESLASDALPDLDSADPGPYGVNFTDLNNNAYVVAYNQERADGVQILVPLGYAADLNNDGDVLDVVNIDLNKDNRCTANEAVNESAITPDQWSILDGAYLVNNNNCAQIVSPSTAGAYPVGQGTETVGPSRMKQIGRAADTYVTGGVDAVSALLMRSAVINEWGARLNPGGAVTENFSQWVITFPTKNYYVDLYNDPNPADDYSPALPALDDLEGMAWAPFTNPYQGGSCESYSMRIFNREERSARFTSPQPWGTNFLCYEVNVLAFSEEFADRGLRSNYSAVVPSVLLPSEPDGSRSDAGWARLEFTGAGTREAANNPRNGTQGEGLGHISAVDRDLDGTYTAAGFDDADLNGNGTLDMLIMSANGTTIQTLGDTDSRSDFAWKSTFWNIAGNNHGHLGLPVSGFMLNVFRTANVNNNHMIIVPHKYERNYGQ